MSEINQYQINTNELQKLFSTRDWILSILNCLQVGRITAFRMVNIDPAIPELGSIPTVDVELLMKRQTIINNSITDYPLLVDLPLIWPGAGDGDLTFPDPTGSTCLVMFADRDIDKWFETGESYRPNSGRMHNLSDGFAILRPRSMKNPMFNYDPEATTLSKGNSKLILKDNSITLTNGNDSLTLKDKVITLTDKKNSLVMDEDKINLTNGTVSISLENDKIIINGDVVFNDSVTGQKGAIFIEDVIATGISLVTHTHTSADPGKPTTPPNK